METHMNRGKRIQDAEPWQEKLMAHLGIADEGEIVSLVDFEERTEFDERLLHVIKEEDYGGSI